MGAWGSGSFDNDDAGDWVWELADAEDTSILEKAFSRVLEADGLLEAPDCTIGLAAAEVVAALRQCPAPKLPEEVATYVARIDTPPSADLVSSALRAVERIKTKSELKELWEESDSRAEWHEAIAELEGRLR
ncbi:MAG TPA: DUF4259 domain-containing protein [Verrucomicrobiae bacterium]|nr:DUF4259 domain-containing protein [Verrucomicrobiae bacterium]